MTLKYHPHVYISEAEYRQDWRCWSEKLRYWSRKRGLRDFKRLDTHFVKSQPHGHVTLIFEPLAPDEAVDLTQTDVLAELHALWPKAAGDRAANGSYTDEVHTPAAWARYVTKDLKDRAEEIEPPPAWWTGPITSSTPGFHAKAKEDLYDDLKRSWGYEVKPRVKKPRKPKASPRPQPRQPYIPSDDVEVLFGPAPITSQATVREPIPAAEPSEGPADSGSVLTDEAPVVATEQDASDPLFSGPAATLYLTSPGNSPKRTSFISIISRLAKHPLRAVPITTSVLEPRTRRRHRHQTRHTHNIHQRRRSLSPARRFRLRRSTRTLEPRCRGP